MTQKIDIVYFAWVKERIGRGMETVDVPPGVDTIEQLIDHLVKAETVYAAAFDNREKLRFALNHNFVQPDAPLAGARELAIFPPVTGG